LDLILTGRPVGAAEALRMGPANRVVPRGSGAAGPADRGVPTGVHASRPALGVRAVRSRPARGDPERAATRARVSRADGPARRAALRIGGGAARNVLETCLRVAAPWS